MAWIGQGISADAAFWSYLVESAQAEMINCDSQEPVKINDETSGAWILLNRCLKLDSNPLRIRA